MADNSNNYIRIVKQAKWEKWIKMTKYMKTRVNNYNLMSTTES